MKKIVCLLLSIAALMTLASCCRSRGEIQRMADGLKEYIPNLKVLLVENLDLFSKVEQILSKDDAVSYSIYVCVVDGVEELRVSISENDTNRSTTETLSESDQFTEEEKAAIEEILHLEEGEIRIDNISSNGFSFVISDGLSDLRLAHATDDKYIESLEEHSYYIEELTDGWYAHIVINY